MKLCLVCFVNDEDAKDAHLAILWRQYIFVYHALNDSSRPPDDQQPIGGVLALVMLNCHHSRSHERRLKLKPLEDVKGGLPGLPAAGGLQWQRNDIPFLPSNQGHISVQQGPDVTVMLACCLQCCNLVCFWRHNQQSSIEHKSRRLFLFLGIKNPIQHVPEAKTGMLYRHREALVIVTEMSQLIFLPALSVASIDQDAPTYMHSFIQDARVAAHRSIQALVLQVHRTSGITSKHQKSFRLPHDTPMIITRL